ncbi:C-C motif chemokine 27 isoform X1 [Chlorocebus sabaeus]|uniref:C-C motif chemokine 27 isoform X1 n=1 Tax=Chlorocebus sabaeus TaxID=60711 RepID=UPI0003AB77DC
MQAVNEKRGRFLEAACHRGGTWSGTGSGDPRPLLARGWHSWNRTRQKQEAFLLPPSTACCTQLYRKPLSDKLLRKVIRVELQEADGDCHLQAFVLHLAQRSICIHPQNPSLSQWFEHQERKLHGTLPNLNFGMLRKMG